MSFDAIWAVPNGDVAAGRAPGFAGAIRIGREIDMHAAGRLAIEPHSPPIRIDTQFRIASLTKPIGGALTLTLVRDGVVRLEDPVDRWLPELEKPRVLVAPDAPLDQTNDAERPITVRHLLTFTAGWGVTLADTPLRNAMFERGVHPGPLTPDMTGDEFVARLAELPLAFQPGTGWLYDTPLDVLGVLLARATGQPLSRLIAERITGPLGMTSTAFWTDHADDFPTAYMPGANGPEVLDPPDGAFARPPKFEELSSGLVSTAPDLLRFFTALADGGAPILTAEEVALMTHDALTPDLRAQGAPILEPGASWGLGTGVDVEAAQPWMAPGRWGWNGGTGTTAYVDPTRDTVGILLTQRGMAGPQDGFNDFWNAVARSVN